LLEIDRPRPVKARAENTNGRKRCLRKQTETSVPETPEKTYDRFLARRATAERLKVSVGTADKWMNERGLP